MNQMIKCFDQTMLYKNYLTLAAHNSFVTGIDAFNLSKSCHEMNKSRIRESKFGLWQSEYLVCTFWWKDAVAEKF